MNDARTFHEPPTTAGLRFLLELVDWIAIYFAWGWIPLVLAVAALSLFGVPGDKHLVLVRVPGPVRIFLEAAVAVLGIVGVWQIGARLDHPTLAVASAAVLLFLHAVLVVLSYRRWVWIWGR